jgi:hypothetical protein
MLVFLFWGNICFAFLKAFSLIVITKFGDKPSRQTENDLLIVAQSLKAKPLR